MERGSRQPCRGINLGEAFWPSGTITFRYVASALDPGLGSAGIKLPPRTANEYWVAYAGPADNTEPKQVSGTFRVAGQGK